MSNKENEAVIERAYEEYREHLWRLYNKHDGSLYEEFCNKMECQPEDYYVAAKNAHQSELWIDSLLYNFIINLKREGIA